MQSHVLATLAFRTEAKEGFLRTALKINQNQLLSRPTWTVVTKEHQLSRRELRKVIMQAKELRQAHLWEWGEMARIESNDTAERAITRIIHAKEQRASFIRLRSIIKGTMKGALLSHLLMEVDGHL